MKVEAPDLRRGWDVRVDLSNELDDDVTTIVGYSSLVSPEWFSYLGLRRRLP
jgi:hypothetical protein